MPSQTITQADQALGVIPAAPWRVKTVQVLSEWRLSVTFNDGVSGLVDLSEAIHAPDAGLLAELKDESYFALAYLDYGAVAWPNGADLAPEAMHDAIQETGIWRVE